MGATHILSIPLEFLRKNQYLQLSPIIRLNIICLLFKLISMFSLELLALNSSLILEFPPITAYLIALELLSSHITST